MAQLKEGRLPPEFSAMLDRLLYGDDHNSIEWKALEEAATLLKLPPARLIERCGGLPSSRDYHLNRFLFEHFPRGTAFTAGAALPEPDDLPLAEAHAFSIDDITTTEIDDAFSVTPLGNGNTSVGIHIAAPALGIAPGSPVDAAARERLSTVYFPGGKITMLPEAVIERYTLGEHRDPPVLSLYLEIAPDFGIVSAATRVERVAIAANLRHDALEASCTKAAFESGAVDHPFGAELSTLWRLAAALAAARGKDDEELEARPEYSFYVENDRVRIVRRFRGTPIDRIVSELMIHVNGTWGRSLAERGAAAIYRVQAGGKVHMSTVPAGTRDWGWKVTPGRARRCGVTWTSSTSAS